MLLGCIADDFTGAGDVANTLARGGMHTRLFVGADATTEPCEAGVIALKTRSIKPEAAVEQSLAALEQLLNAGCRQILFKYCSTFDSTPAGNIGPVAESLALRLGATGVVVCPAFPATGRTVYKGHLFVGDRLLSESGMERHPLTPMSDPDIRRWLSRQTQSQPAHVGLTVVGQGAAAIRGALHASGATLVVVDAVTEDDLRAIGAAAAEQKLLTGGSGVALGLPENFRALGLLGGGIPRFEGSQEPALILSGSCSRATRAQVKAYAAAHPVFEVSIDRLMDGAPVFEEARRFIAENALAAPLVYSSAEPEVVAAAQSRYGVDRAAHAVEDLFGSLAKDAAEAGFGRIVAAGGETSGAVITALGLTNLELGSEIDPGVPALSARSASGRPLALALKSGNFGSPDFLSKAVEVLGGRSG